MEPSPKSPEGKQRRHSHIIVEERKGSTTLGRRWGVLLLSEEGTGQRTVSWPPQHHPITSSCPVRHYPDIPPPELPVESSRYSVALRRCGRADAFGTHGHSTAPSVLTRVFWAGVAVITLMSGSAGQHRANLPRSGVSLNHTAVTVICSSLVILRA